MNYTQDTVKSRLQALPDISPLSRDSIVLSIILGQKRPLKRYKPRANTGHITPGFYGITEVKRLREQGKYAVIRYNKIVQNEFKR